MNRFTADFSGTLDANGSASINSTPLLGTWGALLVIPETSRAVQWTILQAGSVATFGRGAKATLGPLLVAPHEVITIQVDGGEPGANVVGTFRGVHSDEGPQAVAGIYVPVPNTIALDQTEPQNVLLRRLGLVGGSGTLPVPTGTQSLSLVLSGTSNTAWLKVVGHQSGLLLGIAISGGVNEPARVVVPIDSSIDTSIDWTLTLTSGTANAFIDALPTSAPIPFTFGQQFPLHVNNGGVLIAPGTPYTVWTLGADAVNPRCLLLHGWSLNFDAITGPACFASLNVVNGLIFSAPTSNSSELWNARLDAVAGPPTTTAQKQDNQSWSPPLILAATDPTTLAMSLQFQAPVAATSYNARGTMLCSVIPWFPGLGQPLT